MFSGIVEQTEKENGFTGFIYLAMALATGNNGNNLP
jgi:hypothetical protein